MPAIKPLDPADILIVTWQHSLKNPQDRDEKSHDYVWESLCKEFGKKPSGPKSSGGPESYARNSDQFLSELWNYKARQEARDRFFLLHPETDGRLGGFHTALIDLPGTANDKKVCLFHSALRINTDGPTMPVVRLLKQILQEAQPKLVLSVGLGGGVTAEHQVGDVIVANHAEYQLRGDLDGSLRNGVSKQSTWQPKPGLFSGLSFDKQQEPALVPPSPNYDRTGAVPQPPQHQPVVRIADKPVRTCPLLTDNGHVVGIPKGNGKGLDFSAKYAATDMDAASLAEACSDANVADFGFIIGLNVPAVNALSPDDLRDGWIEVFTDRFAAAAAANAARVARAACG